MTRDDPELDARTITSSVQIHYGITIKNMRYLPIGHDFSAFVYEAMTDDDTAYFLKVRSGPISEAALQVPRALIDLGIGNILAPIVTLTGDLRCAMDADHTIVLYPFIHGRNAMEAGLNHGQIREFGKALRAVHDSGLEKRFRDILRVEDFLLPSAALVRQMMSLAHESALESPAAMGLAAFLRENADRIEHILARANEIGRSLQSRPFEPVLCHSDVHTANILVGNEGEIWLIDWDSPLIAPRERDLFFVIGSTIARPITRGQEAIFFDAYGTMEIDPDALIYYRYERIIEDIGEDAKSVFLDPRLGEEMREREADLVRSFFAPGGNLEWVEVVTRSW